MQAVHIATIVCSAITILECCGLVYYARGTRQAAQRAAAAEQRAKAAEQQAISAEQRAIAARDRARDVRAAVSSSAGRRSGRAGGAR